MGRAEELFERLVTGGLDEVNRLIDIGFTEELFLDYKRSANAGTGHKLHDIDRHNLSKAISGFANSEGGVIVWGIDCSRDSKTGADIPSEKFPLENAIRFKSWLEQATSGLTIPLHNTVVHHAIEEDTRSGAGYVISLVPVGMHPPYQSITKNTYYMRAGSNFNKVPHNILSGMFGRRPNPRIAITPVVSSLRQLTLDKRGNTSIPALSIECNLYLKNDGMGLAEDVFLSIHHIENEELFEIVSFKQESSVFSERRTYSLHQSLISNPGIKLPPDAEFFPTTLRLTLPVPLQNPFSIDMTFGATGCETTHYTLSSGDPKDINTGYEELIKTKGRAYRDVRKRLAQPLFPQAAVAIKQNIRSK